MRRTPDFKSLSLLCPVECESVERDSVLSWEGIWWSASFYSRTLLCSWNCQMRAEGWGWACTVQGRGCWLFDHQHALSQSDLTWAFPSLRRVERPKSKCLGRHTRRSQGEKDPWTRWSKSCRIPLWLVLSSCSRVSTAVSGAMAQAWFSPGFSVHAQLTPLELTLLFEVFKSWDPFSLWLFGTELCFLCTSIKELSTLDWALSWSSHEYTQRQGR